MPCKQYHPLEVRAQVLTLWAIGWPPVAIATALDIPLRTVSDMIKRGKDRGYNPTQTQPGSLRMEAKYIEDAKRSGRPKEISEPTEQAILTSVTKDRNGREKSSEILAYEAGISHSSVLRILHKHGLVIAKPSWKPGLTEAIRLKRLKLCKELDSLTDEEFKNIIWTDETSVVLGHRRGAIRVWRTVHDSHNQTCIRRRWKGFSDFMVWGCFSYDKKGPIHIFEPETSQQKKQAEQEIELLNKQLEPQYRAEWELNMQMSRLGLRGKGGRKPEWVWNQKNGKLARNSMKGGIDWWRYQQVSCLSYSRGL
jgi:transposase